MTFQRIKMMVRLLTCLLMLAAVAVQRNGTLLGHDFSKAETVVSDSETGPMVMDGDKMVINSAAIVKDVKGYGGNIPLEITVVDNKIADIKPGKNAESPEFFGKVEKELLPKWIGVPLEDAVNMKVDGVTGATLSSNATNATIRTAAAYAVKEMGDSHIDDIADATPIFTVKNIAALIVILLAMTLPLFIHNKYYRYFQLGLNVVVLGFWCGTFLSYTVFVNYLSSGVNILVALPWLLMLVAAFIYPYFGKKSHYCRWICPLGSLQELAGKSVKYKLKISPKTLKALTKFHDWLWVALMFIMCAGIYSSWMDYELFTAFLFRQASIGVLIAAALFILLSFVVVRPYCRFICPTGCLFQIAQNDYKK